MSQLSSKRVQPNTDPAKLAPRKSQAINLAPRRSAPEKSLSAERGVQELGFPEICIREIDPVQFTVSERLRPQRTLLVWQ
jgi:hypothetical protein